MSCNNTNSFTRRNQGKRGAVKKPTLKVVPITLEDAIEASRKDGELPLMGTAVELEKVS